MTTKSQAPALLSLEELTVPRPASAMLKWVDEAHARFNTRVLRAEFREGKHFANELIHEARPMALFAIRYYGASSQVIITHVLGNQNYDGTVDDRRPMAASIKYLEVTTTLRTYDSLRMEILNKQGHVAAYGPVVAEGPRRNRTLIRADGMAREHKTIRAEHIKRIQNVVDQKAKKHYNKDTALIVAVDDPVPFSGEDDVHALARLAKEDLIPSLRSTNFSLLALEGSQGVHLCFPIVGDAASDGGPGL